MGSTTKEAKTTSIWTICRRLAIMLSICIFAAACIAPNSAWAVRAGSIDNTSNEPSVRILFVGNSFTHLNDDGVTEQLAALAAANHKNATIDRITYSGAFLSDYAVARPGKRARHKAFERKLKNGTWDYIVLQDNSKSAVMNPVRMRCSVSILAERVRSVQPKAKILLYMTHGYNLGTVNTSQGKRYFSTNKLSTSVQAYYGYLGKKLNASVVPVGMYYNKVKTNLPDIDLLAADRKHPSKAGYYLAACSFYHTLFDSYPTRTSDSTIAPPAGDQKRLISQLGTSLFIVQKSALLSEGDSLRLNGYSADGKIVYRSLNPKIASVSSNGTIKAKRNGSTAIYAYNGNGDRATCYVKVECDDFSSKKLMFEKSSMTLTAGNSLYNTPSTSEKLGNYKLKWKSSNPKVAKVNALGNVVGISAGSAIITATAKSKNVSAQYTVRVCAPKPLGVPKVTAKRHNGTVTVSWTRQTLVRGYIVYRAAAGSKKFKRVAKVNGRNITSWKDTTAEQSKRYSYKVRCFAYLNGKARYGAYSKTVKLSVQKKKTSQKSSTSKTSTNTSTPAKTVKASKIAAAA